MKKLMLMLSLFGFMLAGCNEKEKPKYIQFIEEKIEPSLSREEVNYYYTIEKTNDENIIIIKIYYTNDLIKVGKLSYTYIYNIETDEYYS